MTRGETGSGDRSRRLAGAMVLVVAGGLALFAPAVRLLLAGLVLLAGPVSIYGGLFAFLRGNLGMRSASRLVLGLAAGTLAPTLLVLAVIGSGTVALVVGVLGASCSVLALVFAATAFSRERTPAERYVPPTDG
ncbi:hypothetical protein ACFQO4_15970 [Saliphagus sp. GCM10025334]